MVPYCSSWWLITIHPRILSNQILFEAWICGHYLQFQGLVRPDVLSHSYSAFYHCCLSFRTYILRYSVSTPFFPSKLWPSLTLLSVQDHGPGKHGFKPLGKQMFNADTAHWYFIVPIYYLFNTCSGSIDAMLLLTLQTCFSYNKCFDKNHCAGIWW